VLSAAILVATAFVAGVTGAWSPCGFSMVETLGSAAPRVGARVVRTSCATFALGALGGGALTFTALGALGRLLDAGGHTLALVVAVAIALLAALGEALGVRVVPQIRRQVPEPWRRVLPLPLAAGLYGVLLGLGFTTFVLTLAVWALAGIAVAIGSLGAGLAIGIGFGLGRALPVVVMAPRYATLGSRLEARMAEQPALLRRLRLADAALLAALAVAFLAAGSASAAQLTAGAPASAPQSVAGTLARDPSPVASAPHLVAGAPASDPSPVARAARVVPIAGGATDPSFAAGALAWRGLGGSAVLLRGDARTLLPAQDVALGGPYLAVRIGDRITVTNTTTSAVVAQVGVRDATQLAVSSHWLAWRGVRPGGGDHLYAVALPALGRVHLVAGAGGREHISRPTLAGNRLVYAVATTRSSRIVARNLATGTSSNVLRSTLAQLGQPALRGNRLLFVQATYCTQRLRLVALHGRHRPRTLLRIGSTARRDRGRDPGYSTVGSEPSYCPRRTPHRTVAVLWTTALAPGAAYVTLLRPGIGATLARVVL
jgi:hypothetical protein